VIYGYTAYNRPPVEVHYPNPNLNVKEFLTIYKGKKVIPLSIAKDKSHVTLSTVSLLLRVCCQTCEEVMDDVFLRMHISKLLTKNLTQHSLRSV
jgi:hypothetical protein